MLVLLILVFSLVCLVSQAVIFNKAGKEWYSALIPGHNTCKLLSIVDKPLYWYFLLLIPIVNIYFSIVISLELAKRFGKSVLFGVGIVFLPFIFLPIIAFSRTSFVSFN